VTGLHRLRSIDRDSRRRFYRIDEVAWLSKSHNVTCILALTLRRSCALIEAWQRIMKSRSKHVYVEASLFIRLSVNDRRRCSASPEDTDNTRLNRKDTFITRLPGSTSAWFFVTTASAGELRLWLDRDTKVHLFGKSVKSHASSLWRSLSKRGTREVLYFLAP